MRKVTVTQFRRNPEKLIRDCGFTPLAVHNAGGVAFFVLPSHLYKHYLSPVVDLLVANKHIFKSSDQPLLPISKIRLLPVLPEKVSNIISSRLGMGRLSSATKDLKRGELVLEVQIDGFRFSFRESAFDAYRQLKEIDKTVMRKALVAWSDKRYSYFAFPTGSEWHLCMGRENKLAAVIDCANAEDEMVIAAIAEINEGHFNANNYVELL